MASSAAVSVAQNDKFIDRVEFYMKKAAIAVMSEAGSTLNHSERVVYAKMILGGTADMKQYSIGVMTNSTLESMADPDIDGNGIMDSNLEFTVNSIFDAFAGVATV